MSHAIVKAFQEQIIKAECPTVKYGLAKLYIQYSEDEDMGIPPSDEEAIIEISRIVYGS